MKIKWFILLGLVVSLVAGSSVSFALPISVERIRIWQDGDVVFFALQVPELPREIEINQKSTRDGIQDFCYEIPESVIPMSKKNWQRQESVPTAVGRSTCTEMPRLR
jgi:hypothetical protein